MIHRTEFLGYPVDNLEKSDLIDFAVRAISKNTYNFIAVQNANKIYLSDKNKELAKAISNASVILPENAINIGMRWLGKPLKQRNMGGVIMMELFLKIADANSYSIYLLGATEKNLKILNDKIKIKFPGIKILGKHHGFFTENEEEKIVEEISKVKPNFLFVGMGSPKQEIFISRYLSRLNANICMGVGGSFNVLAGIEKPVPYWAKYGLEWLFRSFQDPRKIKRYLIINSYFMYRFIKYIIFNKKK